MRISPRDWAVTAAQRVLISIACDCTFALDRAVVGFMANAIVYIRDVDASTASDVDIGGLIAYARGGDEDRFLAYAHDIGLEVDRDSSITSDVNRVLDRLREFDRDFAVGVASEVDRVLNRLRSFDFDSCFELFDFGSYRPPPSSRDFKRSLCRLIGLIGVLACTLTIARGGALFLAHTGEEEGTAERQHRVMPLAERLLSVGTRLLPAGERARFGEEFGLELWEIAARTRGRRRGQLLYAARQAASAWRLRLALREPRRRGAVP